MLGFASESPMSASVEVSSIWTETSPTFSKVISSSLKEARHNLQSSVH